MKYTAYIFHFDLSSDFLIYQNNFKLLVFNVNSERKILKTHAHILFQIYDMDNDIMYVCIKINLCKGQGVVCEQVPSNFSNPTLSKSMLTFWSSDIKKNEHLHACNHNTI